MHSMGTALEPPAWPAITDEEARHVLDGFGAGRLVALRWHSPRPFSAAVLLDTGSGTLLLKRHHLSVRMPDALAEEHDFIAHLRDAGLAVPDVCAASDGTGSISWGTWTYELHGVGAGSDLYRDRQSWTPYLSHDHAHQAGVALARLHLAARGYDAPARGPHPLIASLTILSARDPLAAVEAYVVVRPALAAFLASRPWQLELARLFALVGEGLSERLTGQQPLWTHNDWHPSNLLWSTNSAVSTIFDFGLATRTCALHDLAIAIERTAIPWLNMAEGRSNVGADAGGAVAILAGYRTLHPLSDADVETIVQLLPLVHLEFALSEVDYFAGILGDPHQAMLAWQGYLIDHARWFLSQPGADFLRQVRQGALA